MIPKQKIGKMLLVFLLTLVSSIGLFAQQPQTSTAPIQPENAKYSQGVGTGYWPTAGSGLTLNIAAGTVICLGTPQTYVGGTLALTDNTTNDVYLNTASSCAPATKVSSFLPSDIPLAVVTTSSGAITSITDERTMFNSPSGTITPVFNTAKYGALGTGNCVTDAATHANNTVTSATAHFLTAAYPAQVGWLAWVYTAAGNGKCGDENLSSGAATLRIGSTTVASSTTITAINSDSSITLSSSTAFTGTNLTLVYCPNDYAPFVAANAAMVAAGGGNIYVPAGVNGIYCVDNSGVGITPPFNVSTNTKSVALVGEGELNVQFMLPPWYNHGNNFGSFLFFGGANATAKDYIHGWTLDLQAIPNTQGPDTLLELINPEADGISCFGTNLNSGSTECLYLSTGGSDVGYVNNYTCRSQYNSCLTVSGPYRLSLINNFLLNSGSGIAQSALTLSSNSGNADITIVGGKYIDAGGAATQSAALQMPNAGTPSGIRVRALGAVFCSTTLQAINVNRSDAILTLDSVRINDNIGSGGNGPCINLVGTNVSALTITAGTVIANNTAFVANGTGNSINNASGSSFIDACGNAFSGGAGYAGSGFLGGSCSITGLAQTSGNIALTSGFGSGAAVSAVSGDSQKEQFTVTYGSTASTSAVLTVTFPTPFLVAPLCSIIDVGGTNAFPTLQTNGTVTATSIAFNLTFASGPTLGNTDIVQVTCR